MERQSRPPIFGPGQSVQSLSRVRLFATPCLQAGQLCLLPPVLKWGMRWLDVLKGPCSQVLSADLLPAAAAAKSLQSCPTLWNLIDGSPPGSPVPGILQARTPEWVAISLSNA